MLLKRSFRSKHERSEKLFFRTLNTQRTSARSALTSTIKLSTVCGLLNGFGLVSELPKLLKKIFSTFRLLSPEFSEWFLPEAWLVKAEQPLSKSFEQKLQYALHFVDLFGHDENLLSVGQLLLNTHLSFFLDFSILVYNETNKFNNNMLKQFRCITKMVQGERHS